MDPAAGNRYTHGVEQVDDEDKKKLAVITLFPGIYITDDCADIDVRVCRL